MKTYILGIITQLPEEAQQQKVKDAKAELDAVLDKHGGTGLVALSLVGAERGE